MATVNLLPNAEGSVQQWTPHPVSFPVIHWNKVDDPVASPDEDSTYVHTSTSDDIEEFNHVTSMLLVGATIANVRLNARLRYHEVAEPSAARVNLGLKIGLTRYPAIANIALTTRYADYTWNWATNPAPPGNPWTKSDIDNLQSSLQAIALSGAQERLTQDYFTVTYFPPYKRPPRPTATVGLPHII